MLCLWCKGTQVMVLVTLFVILVTKGTSGQFLTQPDADTLFVPLNNRVVLSCSVEERYVVDWVITLVGDVDDAREAANTIDFRDILTPRNFTFVGVNSRNSTASFGLLNRAGEQANNATIIACVAQKGFDRVSGNRVQVIFYGAPPPPTNLSVTENKQPGSFNISWSLGFIEGVPVNYTLTVLNLNTTSAQPIIIAGLLDQHYVFETSRPCVYSFTVTAVTAAGNSTPSQELREGNREMCLSITTPSPPSSTGGDAVAGGVIVVLVVIAIVIIILVVLLSCPIMMPKGVEHSSTSHSITVQWNFLHCIRRFAISFSITLIDEDGKVIRKRQKATMNEFFFNHLKSCTTYTVYIAEANEIIYGRSTTKTITTGLSVSPRSLVLTATSDSITATWNPIVLLQDQTLTQYVVKITDENETIVMDEKSVCTDKFTFSSLSPGTTYKVYVAGAYRNGHGPFAVKVATTGPSVSPEGLTLAATSDSIAATWNPILPNSEPKAITHYVVKITEESGRIVDENDVPTNQFTFSSLAPVTTYKVYVAGAIGIGCGPFADKEASTGPSVSPEGLTLAATSNSIAATWNPILPNSEHGTITHYVVKITEESGRIVDEKDVPTNQFTFSSLVPGTTYKLYVAGAIGSGCGPFANKTVATDSVLLDLYVLIIFKLSAVFLLWHFAKTEAREHSFSRHNSSKYCYDDCYMCSHRWLRSSEISTVTCWQEDGPVTMVIPPLKHKCCHKRVVIYTVSSFCGPPRVIRQLLLLAGDVETNPGPETGGSKQQCCNSLDIPLEKDDQAKIHNYLRSLQKSEIVNVGVSLGIDYNKLIDVPAKEIHHSMIAKWLSKQDSVIKLTGIPTLKSLVKALREHGLNGNADTIEEDAIAIDSEVSSSGATVAANSSSKDTIEAAVQVNVKDSICQEKCDSNDFSFQHEEDCDKDLCGTDSSCKCLSLHPNE